MVIALIRHGQTDWNRELRMQGRTDIPLNRTGRQQARDAALRFADGGWDLVVSSPLGRARETAEILADALGIELGGTFDGLIEQEFGEAEGVPVVEIRERWPARDIPGMEPDAAVGARGLAALAEIAGGHPERRVLAVAHGTLIRRTLATLSGHDAEHYPRLDNLSISEVRHLDEAWHVHTVGGVEFTTLVSELDARAAGVPATRAG
ncbi:histidine phosphatase family protein [Agromyces sp. CFH 90414]|uniref:Histidine phosphatase family protein n=1 Tax=Agromyces agglutinans TaxID=2662258 RepID=A0A6I2FAD8_9MICO|nr:histidine phosphatase family protein [Agromyces agglutinans]MRG61224.1 histidine phosphatase family protein [Agromyces agglutinans]